MRVVRALAPLLGLVLAAACARAAPATPRDDPGAPVPTAQSTAQPTAGMNPLEVFQDGFVGRGQPLRNGGAVPLGGDVRAEIFIDPYPATGGSSWLDLYLASNGQPIKNAAVVTDSEMLYMSHAALHQDGRTLGDGH